MKRLRTWVCAVDRFFTVLMGDLDEKRVAAIREMRRRDPLCPLTWMERRELANAEARKKEWMR